MTESQHCGDDAAAYVLGALEPAEAEAVERHMSTCAECRREIEALRGPVEALARAAPTVRAPARLRRQVMREVDRDKREMTPVTSVATSWRRSVVAGAGLAVIAAAFIGGAELGQGSHGGARVVAASVGDARVSISGSQAELIVARLPRVPRGRTYEIWLQHGSAAPVASSLFNVGARGRANVAVRGAISGAGRLLVTEEPSGGTKSPTAKPVIVATIS
ncbi:MAG: anti-sigma factor [Solirubrobacteraceae bacterium]|jgi:anti-sigma-K factor RskA